MNAQVYEFSTFEELFERVPADRMADCLADLAISFFMAKNMMGMISGIDKSMGGAGFSGLFKMPLTWTDDNKGSIKAHIKLGSGDKAKTITIEATRKRKA